MEKKLTYQEKVRIQNNLTHIKQHVVAIGYTQEQIFKYLDEINEILNKED